ncbi:hypothetical protein L3V83_01735 [Thiotrichales bacterium 19X7-9]|nr:hypothetical protein [Thiotrichales bacterium 19X7-9]
MDEEILHLNNISYADKFNKIFNQLMSVTNSTYIYYYLHNDKNKKYIAYSTNKQWQNIYADQLKIKCHLMFNATTALEKSPYSSIILPWEFLECRDKNEVYVNDARKEYGVNNSLTFCFNLGGTCKEYLTIGGNPDDDNFMLHISKSYFVIQPYKLRMRELGFHKMIDQGDTPVDILNYANIGEFSLKNPFSRMTRRKHYDLHEAIHCIR